MQLVISNMASVFQANKMEGSYFLLFILSLVIIYNVNKERNRSYVLFAVGVLLLLVMNPVTVWLLSRMFPVLSTYRVFLLWVPTLLFVPFACVELLENTKNSKHRMQLILLLFVMIALSGNCFGLYKQNKPLYTSVTQEQRQIVKQLKEKKDTVVLADETITPSIRCLSSDIVLLYGKDLWTPNMDMGIMDEYSEEMMALYEAMRNPKECMSDIAAMASMYECDIIVVKKYDGYMKKAGSYELEQETDHYLVYEIR